MSTVMKKITVILGSAICFVFTSAPAFAITLTFDEFPTNTVITNQYASYGLVFEPGTIDGTAPIIYPDGANPSTPILAPNGTSWIYSGDFSIDFTYGAYNVSFDSGYWDDLYSAQIDLFALDDITLIASLTNGVTGIMSTDFSQWGPIGSIYFNSLADGAGSGIDNLTFTPVPEPSTFILLGAGLAGLVAWRRKRS